MPRPKQFLIEFNTKPPSRIFDRILQIPNRGVAAHVRTAAVGKCGKPIIINKFEYNPNSFEYNFKLQIG
ncbi:hypothetical protein MIMGU_mgv1a017541mg [Erythranthe guttata]|uniref:Uncharacterized protein n=1 Tax=Erythranthe guttata TaxID=4155 RepID=A0A022Q2M7_ERYGU|nr:hypothetical protein MIMGU_mgv1a017541mg [Erythranthe guttata]